MSFQRLAAASAMALVVACVMPIVITVAAQAPADTFRAPGAAAQAPVGRGKADPTAVPALGTGTGMNYIPPKSTYVPPKTPWGDPDLQGVYDYQSLLNIERPRELGAKRTLTDAEYVEFAKGPMIRGNAKNADVCGVGSRKDEVCTEKDKEALGYYNEFWNNRNFIRDQRTALIEDPPNGRFPPLTPEAEKRRQEINKHYGGDTWDSWEDTQPLTRCIASQTPNAPQMYNSGTYIMQSPGWVLIVRERLDTRIIPLDGRPHIGKNVHEWQGDSRGHFEGNVLVVDTTNFNPHQLGGGGSGATVPEAIPFGNFHLIERFVPVSEKRINYYATMEDPTTWTAPWTMMLPWEKDPTYTIFEYACNEGNISVGNALRGQRLAEQAPGYVPKPRRAGRGGE